MPNFCIVENSKWDKEEELIKECPFKKVEGMNKECKFLEKNGQYDFCTSSYSRCDYCNYRINYANMTNKQKELIKGLILTSMIESSYYRNELIDLLDLIEEVE